MTARALVIDGDDRRRRLACEALTLFRPGFQVSSARDLDTATAWVAAVDPDLIVIDPGVATVEELASWWVTHDIGKRRVVLHGAPPDEFPESAAIVCYSTDLPTFMQAVRESGNAVSISRSTSHIKEGTQR